MKVNMDYEDFLIMLSPVQKAEIATRLTQVALGMFSFDDPDEPLEFKLRKSINYATMTFKDILLQLESKIDPGRVPSNDEVIESMLSNRDVEENS